MKSNSSNIGDRVVLWKQAGPRFIGFAVTGILALVFLRSTSQFDLMFSDLFFAETPCSTPTENQRCGSFPLAKTDFWNIVRDAGHALPQWLMFLICVQLIWLMMFNPNKTLEQLYPPIVAIITALVGPLVIVNMILKAYWGRPRPDTTAYFGGLHPYVRPGDVSTYCQSNCSFVSGEAAAAFCMLIVCFYFSRKRRLISIAVLFPLALGIALLRIAFGRHYISDVIMSGFVVAVTAAAVIWIFQTRTMGKWMVALLQFSNTYAFGKRNLKN